MMNSNFTELPQNLPVPLDDGAADHLKGKSLPKITLPSTDGGTVELASLTGRFVIYIYPMTGRPGVPLPDGWDAIPGARGCTPQSCSFRDHYKELNALGTMYLDSALRTPSTNGRSATVYIFPSNCSAIAPYS